MTTTVVVKARALGATVEVNGQTTELGPHQDHQFHIEGGTTTFSVTQPEHAEAEQSTTTEEEETPSRPARSTGRGGASGTSAARTDQSAAGSTSEPEA